MIVDAHQFSVCTGAPIERVTVAVLVAANAAMGAYDINTPARVGMFLANVGHETGGLRWLREIWGPTPAQRRYEGRADLGNVRAGDGQRFLGRGWLQTTGRANYRALTLRLRAKGVACPDFEAEPALLERPEWGAMSAANYVDMRHLNAFADRGAFVDYVKGVNGGLNGIEERTRLWTAAQEVLA